eukprot:CAMPEP_0170359134 /NCGR_PEP_ID=MMETSP0117_2-20130122/2596_1 /TAXON_ID=400756 /ORGANISM="Durinskia baltica, Strain CSIRO CS-38" /LENGTH=305 /DNA_ID=CAMNT_0010613383 /DNA_START=90 /DNA_END=1007 /DNA_ORIENTATION=-
MSADASRTPRSATSWLKKQQQAGTAAPLHVLWGTRPADASQSDETSAAGSSLLSSRDDERSRTRHSDAARCRAAALEVLNVNHSAASGMDSSDTPHFVVDQMDSPQHSSCNISGTASASASAVAAADGNRNHILFSDDMTSDNSDCVHGQPRSPGAGDEAGGGKQRRRELVPWVRAPLVRPMQAMHVRALSSWLFQWRRLRLLPPEPPQEAGAAPLQGKAGRFKAIVERQAREAGVAGSAADGTPDGEGSEGGIASSTTTMMSGNASLTKQARILLAAAMRKANDLVPLSRAGEANCSRALQRAL